MTTPTDAKPLAEWPDELPPYLQMSHYWRYERARADAAMERLRVAVACLNAITGDEHLHPTLKYEVDAAIATIGELPE